VSLEAWTHVLPWQQPFAQFDAPHPPVPGFFAWQEPPLQVSPAMVQSWQTDPWLAHCVSVVLVMHAPPLQQPAQDCGPHAALASGAPASMATPPEPPTLLPPLLPDDPPLPDELPLFDERLLPDEDPLLVEASAEEPPPEEGPPSSARYAP
jgi:hypothetical protein